MTSKLNRGECLTMTVKRYDLGTEYRGNIGAPAIVGKVNGRYVRYDDYAALSTHNELLALLLQKTQVALHPAGMTLVGKMRADDQPDGDPWPDVWATLPVGAWLYAALEPTIPGKEAVPPSSEIQAPNKDTERLDKLEKDYFQPIDGGIRAAIDEQISIDAFMGKLR